MAFVLNRNWCKSCGICEYVCPTRAIYIFQDCVECKEDKCIGCCICRDQCPDLAIAITKNQERGIK